MVLLAIVLAPAWPGCTVSPGQGDGTGPGGDGNVFADPDGGGDDGAPDNADGGDQDPNDGNGENGDPDGDDGDPGNGGNGNDGGGSAPDPDNPDDPGGNDPGDGGDPLAKGVYGQFRFGGAASSAAQEVPGLVDVVGDIEGIDSDAYQILFIAADGAQTVTDVGVDGSFEVVLEEEVEYSVVLLEDGRFIAPAFDEVESDDPSGGGIEGDGGIGEDGGDGADPVVPDGEGPTGGGVAFEFDGAALTAASGPLEPAGDPLHVDADNLPVGVSDGVPLVGLSEAAEPVDAPTDAIDADLDGVPSTFDVDADGDGVIDAVDVGVPAAIAPATGGDHVSGAFVFTNLKLDMDGVMGGGTADFPHNDFVVETIGWNENPAESPSGYTVQSVEIQDLPGWHRYGFLTMAGDWTIAPGVATDYPGYPATGSAWTGQLVQENPGSRLWQVWVQAPKADAVIAAAYPDYVVAGESMPLNWDLTGSGVPTSNKIDYYRLKITYSDGVSTTVRYSPAASLFSYRTPPAPVSVTTTAGSTPASISTPGGDGHSNNPITYPDASTAGDIELEVVPPRFDVSSASGVMHGTMLWRADVFYYNAAGQQIGGVLTTAVPFNYTGGANPVVVVPESVLAPAPTRTDMNSDGNGDFFNGRDDSSAIAAYKIDVTAQPVSGGDNTGIFIYFIAESGAAAFTGFPPS
ncbi:MAG: hypothetical protein C4547_14320 [Phycisphaerales bacterium]|nr:MAG: hypothetical protein C4547_14320 [Phycisphaerales bacterium]